MTYGREYEDGKGCEDMTGIVKEPVRFGPLLYLVSLHTKRINYDNYQLEVTCKYHITLSNPESHYTVNIISNN